MFRRIYTLINIRSQKLYSLYKPPQFADYINKYGLYFYVACLYLGYDYTTTHQALWKKDEDKDKDKEKKLINFQKSPTLEDPKIAESRIISQLYDLYNGKNISVPTEIIEMIKKYFIYEINYLMVDKSKIIEKKDIRYYNDIIDTLLKIYNLIKKKKMYMLDPVENLIIDIGWPHGPNIKSREWFLYNPNSKEFNEYEELNFCYYIYKLIHCKHFFTKLYYLNKKYNIIPDYIIIYVLDKYLKYSFSLETGSNNVELFNKKYGFAIDILIDFVNSKKYKSIHDGQSDCGMLRFHLDNDEGASICMYFRNKPDNYYRLNSFYYYVFTTCLNKYKYNAIQVKPW